VQGFRSSGAFGGVVQACEDFLVDRVETRNDPDSVSYGIAVTSLPGYRSSGAITNSAYLLSLPGHAGNIALSFQGTAGGTFGPITVVNPVVRNAYWGLSLVNDSHAKSISIINPQFTACQQYGIVAFAGALRVQGGSIQMESPLAQAAIFVASDGVSSGGEIIIDRVAFSGSFHRRNIQIGGGFGLRHRSLRVTNCTFSGGSRPLELVVGDDRINTLSNLVIENNTGSNFSAGGLSLAFGKRATTHAVVQNNYFMSSDRSPTVDIQINRAGAIW
jgi:hypothetical protein